MKKIVMFMLPVLFLGAGFAALFILMGTAPKPEVADPQVIVPKVSTQAVTTRDHELVLSLTGVVEPAREVSLNAQVGGRVVAVDPRLMPGGRFHEGDTMIQLEQHDYQTAVINAQEALATARYQLAVEQGRQTVALEEWRLFADAMPTTEEGKQLALRQPHLEAARAAVAAAEGRLAKARLDVARTKIPAPFNGVITRRNVAVGQVVNSNSILATLVGTDYYWVKVAIPYNMVSRIDLPDSSGEGGAPAQVKVADTTFQGRVVKLLSDLESGSRMARVLVRIDNPLTRETPLLLGAYVRVELWGKTLKQVVRLPNGALRDLGETAVTGFDDPGRVWLLDLENHLEQRTVQLAWRDKNHVYIAKGLNEGERVITSTISTPLEGMVLALDEQEQRVVVGGEVAQ